jgi:signal transduction histidine kinase
VSSSVARQVAVSGAAILIGALVVVGVGTGVVLHTRAVGALDQALLAAALGHAHPEVEVAVQVEHTRSPIEAWLARPEDPRVPGEAMRRALSGERPLFFDHRGPDDRDQRIVLLPFEVERPDGESHGLAVAAAPRVTLGDSVGPFALVYSAIAALAAVVAMLLQGRSVRRAFRPLDRARDEAAAVLGHGQGARLTEAGPVEVRALVAAMNALLDRLQASHETQTRFTAEAAHELRTPVTTMLGELDVALRVPREAAEYRSTLESTREEVTRLRHLVEGLTALARIDAGQIDHGRERLRATELAVGALRQEERGLALAGCRARLEVDDDSEIDGHRALLEVALSNLLRNAARHAPGGEVVMRVVRQEGQVSFIVDDAGPGVPEAERAVLFDRFTRGHDARRRDRSGLGLGLPLAREVARRHGGDCALGVSPLGGLRVTLSVRALPRAEVEIDDTLGEV